MPNVVLPELEVMQTIANAIVDLTPSQRARVAAWLSVYVSDVEAIEVPASVDADAQDIAVEEVAVEDVEEDAPQTFETFAELYEAVAPKTGIQKVAVAAYWMQTREDKPTWKASEANKMLKGIDVRVSSISIVLTNGLKSKTPLVDMVARNSDSSRSRKVFTLSDAGIAFVEDRLA